MAQSPRALERLRDKAQRQYINEMLMIAISTFASSVLLSPFLSCIPFHDSDNLQPRAHDSSGNIADASPQRHHQRVDNAIDEFPRRLPPPWHDTLVISTGDC
jgi:hypothetical protein